MDEAAEHSANMTTNQASHPPAGLVSTRLERASLSQLASLTPLKAGETHVWFHALDGSPWALQTLPDQAEEQRAQGFLTAQLQQHFRAAHGFKRALLGRYCQQPPAQLAFQILRYGKPQLEHSTLHFNLSHSHGWCALAIAHHPLGVDVEAVQQGEQWHELRRMCLHPLETAETAEAFFRIWCAKEAVGKWDGRGLGVSFPYLRLQALDAENTASAKHWRPQYQTQKPEQQPLPAGQVIQLPHPEGMAAALAWGTEHTQIRCFIA